MDYVVLALAEDSEYKGINGDEMKQLGDAASLAVVNAIKERYPIVAEPSPDVLRVRAAIVGLNPSGSDRIAEVAARCECDAVVNIQGDEPLIDPAVIDAVAGALANQEMSTAATPVRNPEAYDNPNVVKVVADAAGRALYFSRRTIPYPREAASRSPSEQLAAFPFLKHLGIYGYRRETLLRLVKFPVSSLARREAGAVARAGKRHPDRGGEGGL